MRVLTSPLRGLSQASGVPSRYPCNAPTRSWKVGDDSASSNIVPRFFMRVDTNTKYEVWWVEETDEGKHREVVVQCVFCNLSPLLDTSIPLQSAQ